MGANKVGIRRGSNYYTSPWGLKKKKKKKKKKFNIEVINNYSNKNFYNYYAVIPRGTISVCQNRIIKKSLLIKALNFTLHTTHHTPHTTHHTPHTTDRQTHRHTQTDAHTQTHRHTQTNTQTHTQTHTQT